MTAWMTSLIQGSTECDRVFFILSFALPIQAPFNLLFRKSLCHSQLEN